MAGRSYARPALLAILGALALTAAPSVGLSVAGPAAAAPPGTTEMANEAAAQTKAAWLLTQVPLPTGSTSSPRPTSEQVPAGPRLLRVSATGSLRNEQPSQRPFTVRSPRKIKAIVAALNALPLFPPGTYFCPLDRGIRVLLTFYAARDQPPLAVAAVNAEGCGFVDLSIGGVRQPTLEGGPTLIRSIDHELGVRLDLNPSRARY